jgi:hypothetical protein
MPPIQSFLGILARGPRDASCVFNPWHDHDERDRAPARETPAQRRDNFAAYLEHRKGAARVLLLGEAPSHRGCRFSGIAFCSEVELLQKRELVAARALTLTSAGADSKPMRERSAAVIWGEMGEARCARQVVLWNAFPWHPFKAEGSVADGPSGPSSNRRPSRAEVEQGREAFEALLACFEHELAVFAVGKVAEEALRNLGHDSAGCIRHPSMGGEMLFRSQFREQVLGHLQRHA